MEFLFAKSFPARLAFWVVVSVTVCPVTLLRPQQSASMAGHDMSDVQPIPAPEQLPAPIKMSGIGNSHIRIKATPEAQQWFD
jgi:hypothetical protein